MKALQNVFREISGKHGLGAASFVAVAVLFWVICLITLPQVAMLDYSFRFNLPAAEVGGPQDVYTLENYSYFSKATTARSTRSISVSCSRP